MFVEIYVSASDKIGLNAQSRQALRIPQQQSHTITFVVANWSLASRAVGR